MIKKGKTKKMVGKLLLPAAVIAFFLSSCEKDYVYVEKPVVIDSTVVIKFSTDILPIFNADCNLSGCHDGSNYDPDLTPANAWQSLFDMGDIDTTNLPSSAANSILYERVTRSSAQAGFMPKGRSPLSSTQTATILAWIEQGAKNN